MPGRHFESLTGGEAPSRPGSRPAEAIIPRVVIQLARKHYRRTTQPFLFGPRHENDWRIEVLGGYSDGYLLMLHPTVAWGLGLPPPSEGASDEEALELTRALSRAVVAAFTEVPGFFICAGEEFVGFETVEDPIAGLAIHVPGPVEITCLSWVLHERTVGFYLRMFDG